MIIKTILALIGIVGSLFVNSYSYANTDNSSMTDATDNITVNDSSMPTNNPDKSSTSQEIAPSDQQTTTNTDKTINNPEPGSQQNNFAKDYQTENNSNDVNNNTTNDKFMDKKNRLADKIKSLNKSKDKKNTNNDNSKNNKNENDNHNNDLSATANELPTNK